MREWLNRAVSKTVVFARTPRVRIPLSPLLVFWRDDRAAEGARLEVVCTRKGTEGSNPSLSVIKNAMRFLFKEFNFIKLHIGD